MESTRSSRVKNKEAAPVQISAEALLREAVDRQEVAVATPQQRFADLEELHEFQGRKRREFEDYIRRNRIAVNNWLRYATFELENREYARARSIFERALDALPNNVGLWIRYVEAEIKSRNINHARNLLDRAVTRLPRIDKLWYKYVYVEEMLQNIPGVRLVFERWMKWEPDAEAWAAFIRLEKRYGEYDRAREIFRTFTIVHPEPRNWIKWAKFEEEFGNAELVREVFQTAIESLGDEFVDERLFIAYARYEAKLRETERARAIYRFGLDNLPRSKSMLLHKEYTVFEKQFGDKDGIESVILSKRRRHYEAQVKENPKNYDVWFDYARLEEASGDVERVRDVYERAVAQIPPTQEKRHWRRYIYLWIMYALYEETESKSIDRARQIYDTALTLIPHQKFTFAKIWLLKAQFEIRQGQLTAARKTLGRAIGQSPKHKLFKGYLELEKKLYEFERCRILYEKQVIFDPANSQTWIEWAELERGLDDLDRARNIFELAVSQPVLDMPEVVWKAYIDFEEEEGEYERTRKLYERLLQKADHPKVWISYAQFEINIPEPGEEGAEEDEEEEEAAGRPVSAEAKARARKIFERAHERMKQLELKAERVSLLNAWREFERTHGSEEDIESIEKQMPRRTKKKRKLDDDTWEEYVDYVFPADDAQQKGLANLMNMAQMFKKAQGGITGI
jgi:crooked neck